MSDFKIGLYQPASEWTMAGATAGWQDIATMVRLGEDVGFDSVWTSDHLLFRTGDDAPTKGTRECWSLLSAMAAVTRRVEIGPLVSCTGFRNPALLAKIAETVDEISGGRLILGIGAGWHEPEYRAFGIPFDHRYSRFVEAIKIITELLRTGRTDFRGEFYQAIDCELRPRGPRPNGMPVMVGTFGKKMLRVAARYADIWNADWSRSFSEIVGHDHELTLACEETGRDPETLERTACVMIDIEGATGRGSSNRERNQPGKPMSQSEIVGVLGEYRERGYSHVIVWIDPNSPDGIERFAPVLDQLR